MVADDTTHAIDHLGRRSVDLIVGDLPYGVQHGSRTSGHLARKPEDLVETALPVWRDVLRPGGAMALAWNTRTFATEKMISIVSEAGLEPVIDEYTSFRHRVDRAITRDVVVAHRPNSSRG
jgi:tRNA G10  N-methylase Trm11